MTPVLAGFIGYLLVVIVVGLITFRFTKTLADFLLAGRRLGAWVVAFSERASGESAWLLIGLPGLALATGFSAIWSSIGCAAPAPRWSGYTPNYLRVELPGPANLELENRIVRVRAEDVTADGASLLGCLR